MKKALVIGINEYKYFSQLDNCENDATDIHNFLMTNGFESNLILNVNRSELTRYIADFKKSLNPNTTSLIYFSGHGLQDDMHNYLVTRDSEIKIVEDIKYNCIHAADLMINSIDEGMHIVILDACRCNLFKDGRKSIQVGLNKMAAPQGTIIAFSTSPNRASIEKASDRNGVYTKHLLECMQQPNTAIELDFKYTRNSVKRETEGKQIPWEESSLSGKDFSFIEQGQIDTSPLEDFIKETFKKDIKSLSLPNLISVIDTNNLGNEQIEDHQFYLTLAKICMDFEDKSIQKRTIDPDYIVNKTFDYYYPEFIEHLSRSPESNTEISINIFDNIKINNEINFGYNSIDENIEYSFPQFFINEILYEGRNAIMSCFVYINEDETELVLKPLIIYKEEPIEYLKFKKIRGGEVLPFLRRYFELRKPFDKKIEPYAFPIPIIIEEDEDVTEGNNYDSKYSYPFEIGYHEKKFEEETGEKVWMERNRNQYYINDKFFEWAKKYDNVKLIR